MVATLILQKQKKNWLPVTEPVKKVSVISGYFTSLLLLAVYNSVTGTEPKLFVTNGHYQKTINIPSLAKDCEFFSQWPTVLAKTAEKSIK
jgi:hypothetical protein